MKKLPAIQFVAVMFGIALMGAAPTPQSSLQAMVDSEKEFAQVCAQKGIRDSFLQYFRDDVVTFGNKLRIGTEHLKKRPNNDPLRYKLQWLPTYGDISNSGNLGYLTGASILEDTKGENEAWRGQYFSVWTKGGDGWKVAVDFGATTPQAIFKPGAEFTRAPQKTITLAALKSGGSIEEAEQQFRTTASNSNSQQAICDSAAPYLHFYRDSQPLIENRDALCQNNTSGDKRDYKLLKQESSGDLGYAYGEYQATSDAKKAGAYLHVWKRNSSKWMLVAAVEKVNGE